VVRVGLVERTLFPEPVLVVTPVPPLATGNAVPERLNAKVPLLVIGDPVTDKNAGTVMATEVTVPLEALDQVGAPEPLEVKT
jgi:hypothetical protein